MWPFVFTQELPPVKFLRGQPPLTGGQTCNPLCGKCHQHWRIKGEVEGKGWERWRAKGGVTWTERGADSARGRKHHLLSGALTARSRQVETTLGEKGVRPSELDEDGARQLSVHAGQARYQTFYLGTSSIASCICPAVC